MRSETEFHKLGEHYSAGPQTRALGGPIGNQQCRRSVLETPEDRQATGFDPYIKMLLTAAHDSLQSSPIFIFLLLLIICP